MMKAKQGYRNQKSRSPWIGKWLKRYWIKRTCCHQYDGWSTFNGVPMVMPVDQIPDPPEKV